MTWSYDETNLGTSTGAERINTVRLLVGDTDTNDQQVQNEEITFALSEYSDRVYFAAAWIARVIASKYARRVTTKLDGALSAEYDELAEKYRKLAETLEYQGKKVSAEMGVFAGGISVSTTEAVDQLTDRITPDFRLTRFKNPPSRDDPYWDYD